MFVCNLQMNKGKPSGFIRQIISGYAEQQMFYILNCFTFVLILALRI